MTPLIHSVRHRWFFIAGMVLLLVAAAALVPLGMVRVKMLPFDNKSELQVIVNMPDGTPLEQTARSIGAGRSPCPAAERSELSNVYWRFRSI
jgi:multidrug efflux pump subunit AcrB